MRQKDREQLKDLGTVVGGLVFAEGIKSFIPHVPPLAKVVAGALFVFLVKVL